MKTFETVDDYLQEAKENDIIVLGGMTSNKSKSDTYKVVKGTTKDTLVIRAYKGRKNLVLGANAYDQQIVVLTESEFDNLK